MTVKRHSYTGKLYGKTTLTYDFDTLKELRNLITKHPAMTIYKFSDGCTGFRTLTSIKKQLKGKTITLKEPTHDQNKKTIPLYNYFKMKKHAIIKLTNNHRFTCKVLRGYPNTFDIEWYSKQYIISAETKNNLWNNVTITQETNKNDYAQYTIRPAKLIPTHTHKIRTNYGFNYINWSGGNITTYNHENHPDTIDAFNLALFYNEQKKIPSENQTTTKQPLKKGE